MFRAIKSKTVKENAAAAVDLVRQLESNRPLRDHLLCASDLALQAKRRVRRRFGRLAPFREIAADEQLRTELAQMAQEFRSAWEAVEKKRHHRRRNSLLLVAGAGTAGAIVAWRSSRSHDQVQQDERPGVDPPAEGGQAERRAEAA